MLITLKNINKKVMGEQLFSNLNMSINSHEKIGVIGRNGEGKSTLLRILSGDETIDSGDRIVKKGCIIALSEQIPHVDDGTCVWDYLLSGFDEVLRLSEKIHMYERQMAESCTDHVLKLYGEAMEFFMEIGGYEVETRVESVASKLGINKLMQRQWHTLSGGQKTRCSLTKALVTQADVLLLDEPTNHLDIQTIDWLIKYVKGYKGSVICVSHDRYFLDQVMHKIYEIDQHQLDAYIGNYSSAIEQRDAKILLEFQRYKDQQKKIKRIEETIRRLRQWAAEADNEKMFRQAKNMEKALERMDRLQNPSNRNKAAQIVFAEANRSGKIVTRFEDVSFSFKNHTILRHVDMQINYGDRVAITGPNGAGKSTILQLMLGVYKASSGDIYVGEQVKYAYLSQELSEMSEESTILDVFKEHTHVSEFEARHILAKYFFYGERVFTKIKYLSGGEKMRVRIASFFGLQVNTLVFDEPTNHLDIMTREALEDQMETFDGTVIFVSHDRYFIERVATKMIWVENETLIEYLGTVDEMLAHQTEKDK